MVKRLLSNGHFAIQIANAFFLLSGLGIHLYLSRGGLPFADYGKFNVLLSVLTTFSVVFTSGIPLFSVGLISRGEKSVETLFSIILIDSLIATTLLGCLLFFSDFIGGALFEDPELRDYLPLVGLLVFGYLFYGFQVAYVNGRKEYGKQAVITIAHSLIKLVAAVLFSKFWGVTGVLCAYAFPGFVLASYGAIKVLAVEKIDWSELRRKFRGYFGLADFWWFSIPTTLYAFLHGAVIARDLLIVENGLSAELLAVYSVMITLGRVPLHILKAFGTVFFPTYASFDDAGQLRRMFCRDVVVELFLTLGAAFITFILGRWALGILFGEALQRYDTILVLVVISGALHSLRGLLCVKLQATGREMASFVGVIVSFAILEIYGPRMVELHGLLGAACNLLICSLPVFSMLFLYFLYSPVKSLGEES